MKTVYPPKTKLGGGGGYNKDLTQLLNRVRLRPAYCSESDIQVLKSKETSFDCSEYPEDVFHPQHQYAKKA